MKTSVLTFIIGAAVGSSVTWYYTKTKYEHLAAEEIESVKEVFSRKRTAPEESAERGEAFARGFREGIDEATPQRSNMKQNSPRTERTDYTKYSVKKPVVVDKEKEEDEAMVRPYVISPEEFGENDEYDKIGLKFYADKVLTDDDDEKVEDVDNVVGLDAVNHFGEYEDDSVYVRNNRLKTDYEILLDLRNYTDVVNIRPHQMED